ncbi:MAG: hypothetical protein PHQ12_12980, partial [Chthoniobacteraceae bacterium]|nr:hypothetical protein [Chthoniobacteraceae bacterium]
MPTVPLPGCTPTPLAAYLKALGIFRVLATQCPESTPHVYWQGNAFILGSTLDREALTAFFLNRYSPAPLVAPWNGGSGFFPKDNSTALKAIAASTA